ncbi:PEST proteolytic signal-containing nuclear protein-like isoform X2 [Belonocnema kinseyi]|uniref:PEST proteolytic signal-containing nuclear protein-like isoform X2 n=1 Tax=Belonocnema kinseyi TaxID=2817044 RepID=UPI00143D53FC|nr:PEST proteolytic signal-containing nuclear protein-like isoform X2 [Belonocnema kinseyi]
MSRKSSGDDYRKGSSAYRAEESRGDRDDRGRDRERSPLRTDDRRDHQASYNQNDTKKQKLAFGFGKKAPSSDPKKGIQIKLGATSNPSSKPATVQRPTVASVFNTDEDDEPEEMPAEARMRMRNIGRETPTSAGPNSFGKTKQGFCDSKKIFEKTLKKAMEDANK